MATLRDAQFITFDLETTGLYPVGSQIVEVGAVRFRGDGEELGRFQQLVNPRCQIPPEAIDIHGITDRMAADQPAIDEVLPRLVRFFGEAPVVLLAHNAGFDVGFLSAAFSRLGFPNPPHPVLDTCELARRRMTLPNHKLETIGRHLKLIKAEKHRALDDAVLLKDVFLHLVAIRPAIERASGLFKMVPPISFDMFAVVLAEPPAGFEDLWAALANEQPVEIKYMGGSNPGATRLVTPRGVMQTRGHIYLSAYCHQDDCDKTYRLDRIAAYRRTG